MSNNRDDHELCTTLDGFHVASLLKLHARII